MHDGTLPVWVAATCRLIWGTVKFPCWGWFHVCQSCTSLYAENNPISLISLCSFISKIVLKICCPAPISWTCSDLQHLALDFINLFHISHFYWAHFYNKIYHSKGQCRMPLCIDVIYKKMVCMCLPPDAGQESLL